MDILIWIGTVLVLAGIGGLIWCIVTVMRARNAGMEDDALKAKLQSVVIWNFGALLVSALGLMMVVVGVFLG